MIFQWFAKRKAQKERDYRELVEEGRRNKELYEAAWAKSRADWKAEKEAMVAAGIEVSSVDRKSRSDDNGQSITAESQRNTENFTSTNSFLSMLSNVPH